jgi:hypothetical protein
MNRPDIIRVFHALGFEDVKPYHDDEINLRCPFHESPEWRSPSPSAFVQLKKKFFHCFACKAAMSLGQFFLLYKVDSEFISYSSLKELKFQYVDVNGYEKRCFNFEPGTYDRGLKLFREAGDYRLYPDVQNYLKKRLGEGYKIPPGLKIKKHDDRETLVIKGVEPSITERFGGNSAVRFMNYGPACIFHHYTEPVDFLVVVEGLFDYLKVFNAGYNVCALMTSGVSMLKLRQIESISKKHVIMFLDNDSAGFGGTKKITKKMISIGRRVGAVNYSGRRDLTDPGAMDYNTIHDLMKEAME